jgi:putative IMPACT (imprinted ancient) family translation regulator
MPLQPCIGKQLFKLKGFFEKELIVQKSRFITRVAPCKDFDEANLLIQTWSDSKASHNCWAYRGRSDYERYSDDGEPTGTAGMS